MAHKFRPENHGRLTSEERSKYQDPSLAVGYLELLPGARVADVGCGTGFFTFEIASRLVGGELWAIDSSSEMLALFRMRQGEAGIDGIRVLQSSENHIPLSDGYLDRVLMAIVLHEADDKRSFLGEVRRLMKPSGLILLIDWHKAPSPEGPPVEERVAVDEAEALLKECGFQGVERYDIYPYHYLLRAWCGP